MNILDAIADPHLFGSLFKDLETWRPWLSWLRCIYGLPIDDADLALFRQHTGRLTPRPRGYAEAVCIVGCQSGKSQIAALVAVYEAAQAVLTGQSGLYVPLVAQDARSSQRVLMGYVRELVHASPVLSREVTRETDAAIELTGGVTLAVYPCRPSGLRGVRSPCVVLDELAHYLTTDNRPVDSEMLRVARSRVATTNGRVLILSSPYGCAGCLYDLHRRHYGREDSSVLVWQAPAQSMNPLLSQDYLERIRVDDPLAYESEVLGRFRQGLSTLLDPEALDAVVDAGVRERAPQPGTRYVSFTDPASGSGADAFALGIAHADGDRAVLDVVRSWAPPFNPSGVISEAADLLRMYGLSVTTGDAYAAGFVLEGFRAKGITYQASDKDRSAIYLGLLPLVNAGGVLLLDDKDMNRELRGLERRRGSSGRDRVDHRPGSHDDKANSAAGALVLASSLARRGSLGVWDFTTGEVISGVWRDGWEKTPCEYRDGEVWNGYLDPDRDTRGQPLGPPRRVIEGVMQPATKEDWALVLGPDDPRRQTKQD